jgi:hypothetical protein
MPIDYNHPDRKPQTPQGQPRRIVLRDGESVNLSQLARQGRQGRKEGQR